MRILAVIKSTQAKVLAGQFDLLVENVPSKVPVRLQVEVIPKDGKLISVDKEPFGDLNLTPHTDHLLLQI